MMGLRAIPAWAVAALQQRTEGQDPPDNPLRLFPEAASTGAVELDRLLLFQIAVTTGAVLLVFALVIFLALRFQRRQGGPKATPIHGDWRLETVWSAIPLFFFMVFFAWGTWLYFDSVQPPPDAEDVYVIGKQWMWKIYHDGGRQEIDSLHVPAGRPVRLSMTSQDVIHSFYIPAFRLKADVLPGRYTSIWFEATRPGEYHLFCAEYCGAKHSHMRGKVVVLEPGEYQAWLEGSAGETLEEQGATLFERLGCVSCHKLDDAARGPSLAGLYGSQVPLAGGGTVLADESYLRESILEPRARIVAGYEPIMPTFKGQLSEEEVLALITYIKSLSDAE